jgi:antitoxin HicB
MNKIAKRDLNYYLGLHYTVLLREDDEGDVVATIQELQGCMAHGKDAGEAWRNIRKVQRAWIEECLESGDPIPVPEDDEILPSGKWVQRVPRTIHKKLVERARDERVSLNQLVSTMVAAALASGPRRVGGQNSRPHAEPHLRHG